MGKEKYNNFIDTLKYVGKVGLITTIIATLIGIGIIYYLEKNDSPFLNKSITVVEEQETIPETTASEQPSELEVIAKDVTQESLERAMDEVIDSFVHQKNFMFAEDEEYKNLYLFVKDDCDKKGIDFRHALSEFWAESLLTQIKFDNGNYKPVTSVANAFGFTQMTKIALDDLDQKGIKDPCGNRWDFEKTKYDPVYNIAAGISFLKLIEDWYLKPNNIEPNKWADAFYYIAGYDAVNAMKVHGSNPKEYVGNLENIVGKDRADQIKFYFNCIEIYDEASEQAESPLKGDFDVDVVEQNGEMKGLALKPKEDKTVYAMLSGKVAIAGEEANRYGTKDNGKWVQILSYFVDNFAPIKVSYILLDEVNENIKPGMYIEVGTPIGKASEKTKMMGALGYENQGGGGLVINLVDFLVPSIYGSSIQR